MATKGSGTVKQVVSGDTLVLIGNARPGSAPPEKTISLASVAAPRLAMRSQSVETEDEPYAYQSREYLRNMLIGRTVEFVIHYEYNNRPQGSIFFESNNVSAVLIAEGLAKVRGGRPPQCSPYMEDLRMAEEKAKSDKLNIWSDNSEAAQTTIRHIQYMMGDSAGVKAFVAKHRNQKLPAVIEFIRDGGCYRAYFPHHQVLATVLLSGVQVDAFRRVEGSAQPQAEPFAAEAKYFVEIRVLNRDVEIRLEEADDYGNIVGSVLHPRGNVAILLLLNGFARIQEWSLKFTEDPAAMRAALKDAQTKQLRKWAHYEGPTSASDDALQPYTARVLEIVSGDCLMVLPLQGDQEMGERRLYLGSIRCARIGNRSRADEPYAREAREYVRKAIIGKKVHIQVEYIRDPLAANVAGPPPSDSAGRLHYVTVLYDNKRKDLSRELISQGLAKVMPPARNEDTRVAGFDALVALEQEAIEKKIALHGSMTAYAPERLNDLCGPEKRNSATQFVEALKRAGNLSAVVEHVFSGARFRIRIPSESIAISFALSRIRCPAPARVVQGRVVKAAEEFSEEAQRFARDNFLQREVVVVVEAIDRGGTFLGTMVCVKELVNLKVLEAGMGRLSDVGRANPALEAAEASARQKRLGIWSIEETVSPTNYADVGDDLADPGLSGLLTSHQGKAADLNGSATVGALPSVMVVQGDSLLNFYIQDYPPTQVEAVQAAVAAHMQNVSGPKAIGERYTVTAPPKKGEVVLAKYSGDKNYYRGRSEGVERTKHGCRINFIDFGNREIVAVEELYRCPATVAPPQIPPLARRCALAGLKIPIDFEIEGTEALASATSGRVFCCLVESIDAETRRYQVYLYPIKTSSPEEAEANKEAAIQGEVTSLNEQLLMEGYALVDKKAKTADIKKLFAAQNVARKAHKNIWRHGDIDEDSDAESVIGGELTDEDVIEAEDAAAQTPPVALPNVPVPSTPSLLGGGQQPLVVPGSGVGGGGTIVAVGSGGGGDGGGCGCDDCCCGCGGDHMMHDEEYDDRQYDEDDQGYETEGDVNSDEDYLNSESESSTEEESTTVT